MASSPHKDTKRYLDDPEETLFMQVFVEEVGIWMDSLDSLKHVSLYTFHKALNHLTIVVFPTIAFYFIR